MKNIIWVLVSVVIMISLTACGAGPEPDGADPTLAPDEPVTGLPDQAEEPTSTDILPDNKNLVRGDVFIGSAELLILESFPIQVVLVLTGELPTPCDVFGYSIESPNDVNQFHVEAYSLGEPGAICVQVLQPFEENISISSLDTPLEDGGYTVWLNGELVGEFNYPGG